jgi:hypothetical protein
MNFSGNVGKSTVAKYLLQPRIADAEMYSVESINATENEMAAQLRGEEFGDLMQKILASTNAIVDVGASNIEAFMLAMEDFIGSHEDYDYFVVPAVPDEKQIRDTISTIEALAKLGVPARKIRVVMNMVGRRMKPEKAFVSLFEYAKSDKAFTMYPGAVMHENELYTVIKRTNSSIEELVEDHNDLKAMLLEATDSNEQALITGRIAARRLALGVKAELDLTYKALIN